MKNKFTKGEWKREGRTVFIPVYNDKAGCETVNMILEKEEGEAEANAKLIAAAPKLFKLAEHILAMQDDAHFIEHPEWHEIVKEAETAIKATE